MKRDDDLLRQLLIDFEEQSDWLILFPSKMSMTHDERRKEHYIHLLLDQGFVASVGRDTYRMTSQGHDYLEVIRDKGIWEKTKKVVNETGGSATIEILKTLATGFLKKKISEQTGIEL